MFYQTSTYLALLQSSTCILLSIFMDAPYEGLDALVNILANPPSFVLRA